MTTVRCSRAAPSLSGGASPYSLGPTTGRTLLNCIHAETHLFTCMQYVYVFTVHKAKSLLTMLWLWLFAQHMHAHMHFESSTTTLLARKSITVNFTPVSPAECETPTHTAHENSVRGTKFYMCTPTYGYPEYIIHRSIMFSKQHA